MVSLGVRVADSLVSVNVGLPRDVAWQGRVVHTGIWKSPVDGPVMARTLNLDGDGQGDLGGHGGEQRAVFVYQLDSYRYWQDYLRRDDFTHGMFGENFTVEGLPDAEVCIGDRFRIGEAEFEVTQPRTTCYRVGIRLAESQMPSLLVSHHRPGFYFRVITEGHVAAGDTIVRTYEDPRRLSVADVDALLYLPDADADVVRTAATIPALSPGWRQSFQDLVAAAEQAAASPAPSTETGPTGWTGFAPLKVVSVKPETDTVTSVYLSAPDDKPLPPAQAGQYLTVRLTFDDRPVIRTYSLSSAPGADRYRLSVKRESKGVASTYLTQQLQVGQVLDAASPRGEFILTEEATPVILMSAGIGVTPVLAMLHQLAQGGSSREVWWISAARTPEQNPLAQEAHDLMTQLANGREYVFYSAAGNRLTQDSLARLSLPSDATAYLCGPNGFMTDMQAALQGLGLSPGRIRSEVFGARSAINPGVIAGSAPAPHAPPNPGSGPQVTFSRSALSVAFETTLGSLLEMAELCDVPTRWSCRSGVCHTCSTPLLGGRVDYAPEPLEPATDGEVLLCCATPATDVILDM
jgi:ferredoxin-NADP reductase/MOSC domain-containing protein YiiM